VKLLDFGLAKRVASLKPALAEDALRRLLVTQLNALYAPPYAGRPAQVLWQRDHTLVAQPFDEKNSRFAGDAVPVEEGIDSQIGYHLQYLSVSRTGILAYAAGSSRTRVAWVDRTGQVVAPVVEPGDHNNVRLSRDGTRLALDQSDSSANWDIWQLELSRGCLTRFTFDAAADSYPVWSPDGREIVFSSDRDGVTHLFRKYASGARPEERLTQSQNAQYGMDWSPDGRYLMCFELSPENGSDLWLLPMRGGSPIPFLQTPFVETQGQFFPVAPSRWVAYASDESGKLEVYVRSFTAPGDPPAADLKYQISTKGGSHPRWRADGKELFYIDSARMLMAAKITEKGNPPADSDARLPGRGHNH
jgi:Tol biopolymer transport system component